MNRLDMMEFVKNHTHPTKDKKYNDGRKQVIQGAFFSEQAEYFMLCEGLHLTAER